MMRYPWRQSHDMIAYLKKERYNTKYGLLIGATTADWGDVQPLSAYCSASAFFHSDMRV